MYRSWTLLGRVRDDEWSMRPMVVAISKVDDAYENALNSRSRISNLPSRGEVPALPVSPRDHPRAAGGAAA